MTTDVNNKKWPAGKRVKVIVDGCPLCRFAVSAQTVDAAWANVQDHFTAVHQSASAKAS